MQNSLGHVQEGGIGIFSFVDLANFWLSFSGFIHVLTNWFFWFWCLVVFVSVLQFSLWFFVFVNSDGGFSDFSAQCILQVFWFCQGSCAKTVIPRDHSKLDECMRSLVSLVAVIWARLGVNSA